MLRRFSRSLRANARTLAISAGVVAAAFAFSPDASAQTSSLPAEVPEVNVSVAPLDSGAVVDQARADAAQLGVELPPVDQAITGAIDDAVNQFLPAPSEPAQPAAAVEAVEAAPEPAQPADPGLTNPDPIGIDQVRDVAEPLPVTTDANYVWRNDPVSKALAGKPFENYVLHRVPGSFFDAPRVPEESNQALTRGNSLYGPGTPIYVGDDVMCTLTVAGTDDAGRKVGVTAGHCGEVGDSVASADSWQVGPSGTVVARNEYLDYSVIEFGSNAEVTDSYNGVTVTSVGGEPQPGQIVCKQGVATGETCGMTLVGSNDMQINQVCAMVGDSGAPLYYGGRLMGMVNGGVGPWPFDIQCVSPLQGALHAPTASTRMDAVVADMNARGGVGRGFKVGAD